MPIASAAGTAALERPSPPKNGTAAAASAITRHAPSRRNVTETDGRAVSSGDIWPYWRCALDTGLKRCSASRLARTDQTDFVASCTSCWYDSARGEPGGTCRDDCHEPRSAAPRRGCRANVPAAGAGDDAPRSGLHGLFGLRVGACQLHSRRLGLRGSRRSGRRPRQVPDTRRRRRERLRHRRRRRPAARLPEHLPAPRRPPADRARGLHAADPVLVSRLDLRLRRQPQERALHRRPGRLRPEVLRAARGPARGRRGPRAARPLRRGAAAAGPHRRPRAAAGQVPQRRPAARRADRLRRRRQLEGDRRELQRVPALPGRAPGAQPALALPVRRDDQRLRPLVRRLDDAGRGRRGHDRRRRAHAQADRRRRRALDPVLPDLPEHARLAAPGLRDAAHAVAEGAGPHRGRLRVVLRARGDRGRRTSTRPTPSSSGTRSTARTGTSARSRSRAWSRPRSRRGATRRRRTTCTSST